MNASNRILIACLTILLSSCAPIPLSEQLAGRKIPTAPLFKTDQVAELKYSGDKKFESASGVPLKGDPLVCADGKVYRVNQDGSDSNRISVEAGKEIAVTSVVAWVNTGFRKTCGPFVRFTPEAGATYIVVNERIGGKGISAMWTGIAFQTCQVSVYREAGTGFAKVPTQSAQPDACRVPEA